ncbi:MAG: peptide ABC transporter substrate-binding protein [Oscillochloris sp.]|nr:peptide ABC transporter substrate-binding protein [Oscillochloris sp.]
MARRIRWQIVIAALSALLVAGLLGRLALLSTSVASPLQGGSYIEALVGAPQQPVPLLNDPLTDPSGAALITLLFDGLLRIGADGLIEPALAADYQLDATGEVYTFQLRRDVRWHDGTPFTADDVVFTLRTLQSLDQIGDPLAAQIWQDVLVDRIDDYTVRATLSAPLASFPSLARVPMLPAHLLADVPAQNWPQTDFARTLIGTGPYQLAELGPEAARLTANPAYFDGRPYIDTLELRFFTAAQAAAAALGRGELSAYGERAGATLAAQDLPADLQLRSAPLDEYATLTMNMRTAPLDQLPLRRALAYATSRDALIERVLNGLATPLDRPILVGSWAYDPLLEGYPYDPARAVQLLGEIGYEPSVGGTRARDGRPLRLELIVDREPRRLAAAEEIARQWAEIGVAVDVVPLEPLELLARLQQRDFTLALHSWARIGPDPDAFALWHSSQADTGLNYAGLADPQIDTLLEDARRESELAQRSVLYADFQDRWMELAPSLTLFQSRYYIALDARVGGITFDDPQLGQQMLYGVEDRYRTVRRWFTDSYREIEGDLE